MRKRTTVFSLLFAAALCGCNDEDQSGQPAGGGPGSATPGASAVLDGALVNCGPVGGLGALGQASYSAIATAKIDSDGDPDASGKDANWQAQTSGHVNAATSPFVVMSSTEMENDGVSLGDWAVVRNEATGQQTWAQVQDRGPDGGAGEISEAAATAVGIQYEDATRFTVGNPTVAVQVYGGTAGISSDCNA